MKKAFTLIELLVVIAIISILSAILFPVILNVKRSAASTSCRSNLRQQFLALNLYLDNNDDTFPFIDFDWGGDGGLWATEVRQQQNPQSEPNLFRPFDSSDGIFDCPGDIGFVAVVDILHPGDPTDRRHIPAFTRWGTSYRPAAELGGMDLSQIPDPTSIFWAADDEGYWHEKFNRDVRDTGGNDDVNNDNDDFKKWQTNAVFLDGHLKTIPFWDTLWRPYLSFLCSLSPNPCSS